MSEQKINTFALRRIRSGLEDNSVPARQGAIPPRDQLQLAIAHLLLEIRDLLTEES